MKTPRVLKTSVSFLVAQQTKDPVWPLQRLGRCGSTGSVPGLGSHTPQMQPKKKKNRSCRPISPGPRDWPPVVSSQMAAKFKHPAPQQEDSKAGGPWSGAPRPAGTFKLKQNQLLSQLQWAQKLVKGTGPTLHVSTRVAAGQVVPCDKMTFYILG